MAPVVARARATLSRISPPVWRILLHSLIFGLAMSVADLLFNFYLVSLGYRADTAGLLSTVTRAAGMLLGVPAGMLIDRLGPQRALLLGLLGYAVGWAVMIQATALWALVAMQFMIGTAFILAATAVIPLLTRVTTDTQRASVFGMNASASLIVGLVGSMFGGVLPSLAAGVLEVDPQSTAAYRLALASVVALGVLAMLPVLARLPTSPSTHEATPAGAIVAERLPLWTLVRFAFPALLLGIAGGAILPFQNLFFRYTFQLDDVAVGTTLAWASLGMGLGALIGAPVAARVGLQRGAALLRLGAVPGMLLMLSPALLPAAAGFFLRGLCVAASFPLMDALVMRSTSPAQRGMATSMTSVFWSGGWALSSLICGLIEPRWGFPPILILSAVAYILSTIAIFQMPIRREA